MKGRGVCLLSLVLEIYPNSIKWDKSLVKNLTFQNPPKGDAETDCFNKQSIQKLILLYALAVSNHWNIWWLEFPELIFPIQTWRLDEGFVMELRCQFSLVTACTEGVRPIYYPADPQVRGYVSEKGRPKAVDVS